MSKIETGNFDFRPEPFDPIELAIGCCDLMQIEADQARVTLRRDIAAGQQEIVADRRAVKQIMLNLLSNAIKFTPAGGRVTMAAERDVQALRHPRHRRRHRHRRERSRQARLAVLPGAFLLRPAL